MATEQSELVTATSIQMRAEITRCDNGLFVGVLHSKYLAKPYEFCELIQMIEKMEEIFNDKRFPDAFLSPRVLNPMIMEGKSRCSADRADDVMDMKKVIEQSGQNGKKCTFEISVKFRQNATWQGSILWIEKNLNQNFRSVLEMLKLMDEALSDGAEDDVEVNWDNE